jgi:hypothetical protein
VISKRVWELSTTPHIYMLTLLVDLDVFKAGTIYIGQTNGHSIKYVTGGVIPRRIMKKHGRKCFSRVIIEQSEGFSKSDLDALEQLYIEHYKCRTTDRPGGMNITRGGDDVGMPKMVRCEQYNANGWHIASWESMAEAGRSVGTTSSTIYSACSGKCKTICGYQWRFCFEGCKIDPVLPPIYQFDLDKSLIKKWDNVYDAARFLKVKPSGLVNFALHRGRQRRYIKKFLWSYEEVYPYGVEIDVSRYDQSGFVQICPHTGETRWWKTPGEAANFLGINHKTGISNAARHGTLCKGLYWRREKLVGSKKPKVKDWEGRGTSDIKYMYKPTYRKPRV